MRPGQVNQAEGVVLDLPGALVAAPAEYKVTGVQTFMVGPDGVVYEKDMGPDTLKQFESMERYNPDKSWKVTDDDWPEDEEDEGESGAAE